jgi:uncharacterized protein (TIGR02646 family)
MIKVERTESPECLKENYKNWGKQLKVSWEVNSNYSFHWHGRYDEIAEDLFIMTDNHCSFCDIQPLRQSGATIEHFRPKKKFPLLAYAWVNLFYCCTNCQKKRDEFDKKCKPLKPDQINYAFIYYFRIEETIEEVFIRPNLERSVEEQNRAEETIKLYGLNKFARPEARKNVLEDYREDRRLNKNKDINCYSYRFILH